MPRLNDHGTLLTSPKIIRQLRKHSWSRWLPSLGTDAIPSFHYVAFVGKALHGNVRVEATGHFSLLLYHTKIGSAITLIKQSGSRFLVIHSCYPSVISNSTCVSSSKRVPLCDLLISFHRHLEHNSHSTCSKPPPNHSAITLTRSHHTDHLLIRSIIPPDTPPCLSQ
jgi:hypothetical protein